jgi:probable rRNA maturation factor
MKAAVNVLVTGNRELRALNSRFRKKDKATDVLSFPPMPGLRHEFAGDVAISAEAAKQNARHLGHSAAEEIKILALHGILHLAGYDHEHDGGRMARKESQLRTLFSLPDGLIERSVELGRLERKRDGRRPAKGRPGVEKSAGAARSEQDRGAGRATPAR